MDAGGGTIDLSAYQKIEEDTSECYEEIATPECRFMLYISMIFPFINLVITGLFCGSVYVNFYARKFLGSQFLDSFKYAVPSDHH